MSCLLTLQYNPVYDIALSSDKAGMIEYWSGQKLGYKFPAKQLKFQYKTDTDLFEFVMVSLTSPLIAFLSACHLALKGRFKDTESHAYRAVF